jgi:hypothetical protein
LFCEGYEIVITTTVQLWYYKIRASLINLRVVVVDITTDLDKVIVVKTAVGVAVAVVAMEVEVLITKRIQKEGKHWMGFWLGL